MKSEIVSTNNQGELKPLDGFVFLRGQDNAGKLMGLAVDSNEKIFAIYPAPCDLDCYCWATAKPVRTKNYIKNRLEALRKELRAERISYGEMLELESLSEHIEAGDVELLEPAGVPEFKEEETL